MPHLTPQAQRQLVEEHVPWVSVVARAVIRGFPSHLRLEDFVASGLCGLLEAARRYDPVLQGDFKKFAYARIRGQMIDDLRSHDPLTRDMRRLALGIAAAAARAEVETGRVATDEDVATELGIPLAKLYKQRLKLSGQSVHYMEDLGPAFMEAFPDEGAVDPLAAANRSRTLALLEEAVQRLPDRYQLALALFYGEELTQKEIGTVMGVTESRVCQILKRSAAELRELLDPEMAEA